MNNYLYIGIIALLLLIVGGALWEIIRPKTKPVTIIEYETLTITKEDTIRILSPPIIRYVEKAKYIVSQTHADSCHAALERCLTDREYLAELEAEAEKTVPGGSVVARWSMPRFIEHGNGFDIEARFTPLPPVTVYKDKKVGLFERFGFGLQAGAGVALTPNGARPAVYVGAGVHFDMKEIFR